MAFSTFLISSFTFDGTAVTSKGSATVDRTSSVNTHSADSSRANNLVTTDRRGVTVTIESFDQSILDNSKFEVGAVSGQLVIVGKKRSAGAGLSNTYTITIPNAIVTNSSETITSEGEGTATISFEAFDPAADDSTDVNLISTSVSA